MMINNQPAIIQNVNTNQNTKQEMTQQATKTVTVNVLNQQSKLVKTYKISGKLNQKVGSQLKDQNQVIEVLNNGQATTINNLQNSTFKNLGNVVTVITQEGIGVKTSCTINGQIYSLPQNVNNSVTLNSAKIYVPSTILNNPNNQLTSVAIDGVEYMGTREGNYILVNAPIAAIGGSAHNVVLNFENIEQIRLDRQKEAKKPATPGNGTANVNVVIMNQYGQEISSQQLTNANGYTLAQYIANAKNPIENISYNGTTVTLMDLLQQTYVPGTNNLFVLTETTQSPTYVYANIGANRRITIPSVNAAINSEGATIEIPTALTRNFKITSATINGVQYPGSVLGGSYIVSQFVPSAPEYVIDLNLQHK
ncbi:MAG: hypothetical protein ACRCTZ_20315 [Sarcina sp.]